MFIPNHSVQIVATFIKHAFLIFQIRTEIVLTTFLKIEVS